MRIASLARLPIDVFLVAIFLPDHRLVVGALPFWDAFRQRRDVRAAIAGVNACVVGILLSALYDPIALAATSGWLLAIA